MKFKQNSHLEADSKFESRHSLIPKQSLQIIFSLSL